MEISFSDDKLQNLWEQPKLAQRKLGANCAKKLAARLADLDALNCVTELFAGRPHPLKGDRAGEFAVDVSLFCQPFPRPIYSSNKKSSSFSRSENYSL